MKAKVGDETEFTEISPDTGRDNIYRASVKNIAANNLDVVLPFTVTLDDAVVFSTQANTMDYISTVLKNSASEDEKLALAALYEYWAAAALY